jgi:hypothetical protein
MRNFVFLITDNPRFTTSTELALELGHATAEAFMKHQPDIVDDLLAEEGISAYRFSAPADLSDELIVLIGRGKAFSNNWIDDETVSILLEA